MQTATLEVTHGDVTASIRSLLEQVLSLEEIDAVMVPGRRPDSSAVMPLLISNPDLLELADPLAPAFMLNAARQVCRLTHGPMTGRVAAVMRPCEIRAFVELVKLKQGDRDQVLIIGIDCLGAYPNDVFASLPDPTDDTLTREFVQSRLSDPNREKDGATLAKACRACEQCLPSGADLAVCLWGIDTDKELMVQAQTESALKVFDSLALKKSALPSERKTAVEAIVADRTQFRDQMFADTDAATDSIEKLALYLDHCINCYNCRTACPVCYCRQCVFETNLFDHEPMQYMAWAKRKGQIKMPTDTIFYHLTRLAHMSTACVGCGQCSNACPNDIDVMSLFRTVAHRTQATFDYVAGRDVEEKPPLSEFREQEFPEVEGLHWEKE